MSYSMLNDVTMPSVFVNESNGYTVQSVISENDILQAATSIIRSRFVQLEKLDSVNKSKDFFSLQLSLLEHEVFCVAFLTTGNSLIACEQMFRGTVNCAQVYPREVVKRALELNAASVIFAHNHPGGSFEPSQDDKEITMRLEKTLHLVNIRVLDHLIVGKARIFSFAEYGLLDK